MELRQLTNALHLWELCVSPHREPSAERIRALDDALNRVAAQFNAWSFSKHLAWSPATFSSRNKSPKRILQKLLALELASVTLTALSEPYAGLGKCS
jgi:hypothetical protein